jgi:hypothetical protein
MVAFPSRLLTPQVILGRSAFPRGVLVRADVYRSGGLDPTGGSNSGCSSSTGQVYARAGAYSGKFGIMYSWYMPKDSPSSGLGHRHDWENIVVWLSAQSTSATITGVAISAHGGYQKDSSPGLQGTSPKIGYISYFPVNHQLIATNDLGGQQPLIAWDSMTAAARTAIENTVSDTLKCLRGLAKNSSRTSALRPPASGTAISKATWRMLYSKAAIVMAGSNGPGVQPLRVGTMYWATRLTNNEYAYSNPCDQSFKAPAEPIV